MTKPADCLSDVERAGMHNAARRRPPKSTRDAEKDAKRAAVDAWLFNNGWRDWQGDPVAQCGTCGDVADGGRFVARRIGKDGRGPLVIRCAACVAQAMP